MPVLDSLDALVDLAPTDLVNYRELRYDGTGFGVPLAALAPADQALVRQLYTAVQGVHDLAQAVGPDAGDARLVQAVQTVGSPRFTADAQALGEATAADRPGPQIGKVLHDLRGGALCALVGTAGLLALRPGSPGLVPTCATLARDHAKIMRSAVVDLDPPRRQQDLVTCLHGIGEFVRKWDGTTVREDGRALAVAVRCTYQGAITARCLENAAIDRILYNHINNAARFAADGRATLSIFPVGDALVRWVIGNAVGPEHREWLATATGGDLRHLYRGGLTAGGQGIGLGTCADIVAACFGLPTRQAAVDRAYLGVRLVGDRYDAWFHWPACDPGQGPALGAP